METKVIIELTECERDLAQGLEGLNKALYFFNRGGVEEYSHWATQRDDLPYGRVSDVFLDLAGELFGSSKIAKRLLDLCVNNGESVLYQIDKNADLLLGIESGFRRLP